MAIIGSVIIVIVLLIALLAYLIAPDGSPNANRQIVEIARKKMGSTQLFYLQKNNQIAEGNYLYKLLNGSNDTVTYIPIQSYAVKADSIVIQKYIDEDITQAQAYALYNQPNVKNSVIKKTYYLGTDNFGRDILSRLLVGTRVSISVGIIAVLISLVIGIGLGAAAGYYKGNIDTVIMWLINVIWSVPTMLLVFALTIALGKGFWQVFIAVGLTMWVNIARLVRGQVLKEREMQYVEAAAVMGYSNFRIITKHILPNIAGPIIVMAASNFASAIIIEAGLSFLGIGVQAPKPSWGLMVKENYTFILTSNPMLALIPGIAIMVLVLAFYLLGNGLRDAMQVK